MSKTIKFFSSSGKGINNLEGTTGIRRYVDLSQDSSEIANNLTSQANARQSYMRNENESAIIQDMIDSN